jgi:hypothetical protein
MAPKDKYGDTFKNLILPPPFNLDHIPLTNKDYKVIEPRCEFDFFELHSWIKDIFLNQSDEIGLWESNFPLYISPQTHHFLNFLSDVKPATCPTKESLPPPLLKRCS